MTKHGFGQLRNLPPPPKKKKAMVFLPSNHFKPTQKRVCAKPKKTQTRLEIRAVLQKLLAFWAAGSDRFGLLSAPAPLLTRSAAWKISPRLAAHARKNKSHGPAPVLGPPQKMRNTPRFQASVRSLKARVNSFFRGAPIFNEHEGVTLLLCGLDSGAGDWDLPCSRRTKAECQLRMRILQY